MFGRGKRVEAVSSHMPSAIIAQAGRGEGRGAFLIEIDQSRQTQRELKLIKGEIVGRPLPPSLLCCCKNPLSRFLSSARPRLWVVSVWVLRENQ